MPELARHHRNYDQVQYAYEFFGIVDDKGRTVGAQIERATTVYTMDGAGSLLRCATLDGRYPTEPCTLYEMVVQATRNRTTYGARQPWRGFRTKEEREAAIEKALAGARKRASKKGWR